MQHSAQEENSVDDLVRSWAAMSVAPTPGDTTLRPVVDWSRSSSGVDWGNSYPGSNVHDVAMDEDEDEDEEL